MGKLEESTSTHKNPKYCWSLLAKLTIIPMIMVIWMFGVYIISLSNCTVPYTEQTSFALTEVIGICAIIGTTIFALINFCRPFINFLQFLFEDDECEDHNESFKRQVSLLTRVQLAITFFLGALCFFVSKNMLSTLSLQWLVSFFISSVVHILTVNFEGREECTQFFIFLVVTAFTTCCIQQYMASRIIFLFGGFTFWFLIYKVLYRIIRKDTKDYERILKKKMSRYLMIMLFNLILITNVFVNNYDSPEFILLKQTPIIDYCKHIFQSEVPKKIFSWIVSCI